jgi:hypothetical protein
VSKLDLKTGLRIRDAEVEDVNFIFNSWLKSFRAGTMCRDVESTIYFSEHHKLIEKLVRRGTTRVVCADNDPATIIGWACYERIDGILVVHYAYTKHTFRALGVQRKLIEELQTDFKLASIYTHQTLLAKRLATKYNMIYHPYILINYGNEEAKKTEEVKP